MFYRFQLKSYSKNNWIYNFWPVPVVSNVKIKNSSKNSKNKLANLNVRNINVCWLELFLPAQNIDRKENWFQLQIYSDVVQIDIILYDDSWLKKSISFL